MRVAVEVLDLVCEVRGGCRFVEDRAGVVFPETGGRGPRQRTTIPGLGRGRGRNSGCRGAVYARRGTLPCTNWLRISGL